MQMLMLARVFACLVALQDGTELHEVVVHEHREPIEVAREIYPDLRADIAELEGSTFLEDEHNVLLALLYLSTISPSNKKVPWTQDDDRVFRDAERAVERTSFWLKWGLLLLVPLACFGLLGLFVLVPENNEASVVSYVVTVTVCVTVSTVLVTVLAFFYTGIFPDTSSIKANDRQNAVGALKEKYRGFGTDLLRIHAQHPDLAVAIASTVDVPHLRDLLVRRTHDTYAAFIFTDFQEAANYISNPRQNFPHKPFLHLYLAELHRGSLPMFNILERRPASTPPGHKHKRKPKPSRPSLSRSDSAASTSDVDVVSLS